MKLVFSLILVFALSTGSVAAQQAMAEPPCPPMCHPDENFQGGYSGQAVLSVFWLGVYYSVFSS